MTVCLCRGVSERAIRAVIVAGAATVDEIAEACGAGVDCRACGSVLAKLVAEAPSTQYSDVAAR